MFRRAKPFSVLALLALFALREHFDLCFIHQRKVAARVVCQTTHCPGQWVFYPKSTHPIIRVGSLVSLPLRYSTGITMVSLRYQLHIFLLLLLYHVEITEITQSRPFPDVFVYDGSLTTFTSVSRAQSGARFTCVTHYLRKLYNLKGTCSFPHPPSSPYYRSVPSFPFRPS